MRARVTWTLLSLSISCLRVVEQQAERSRAMRAQFVVQEMQCFLLYFGARPLCWMERELLNVTHMSDKFSFPRRNRFETDLARSLGS
mmetsp:Transcript_33404/g.81240  ORF Transcript_33404/g.81240 Transcript_33404/m.81240 type:complete len:87 (-) Transcript_33404:94-354(-)